MKKLLLILSAVFVSVMSWAQNPYAYDLETSLNANSDAVTLTYKLNADATNVGVYLLYNDGGEYRRVNKNGSEWNISNGGKTKNGSPHAIQLAMTDIPEEYNGKDLTWEVVVNGTSVTKPQIVGSVAEGYRPQNAYGIAVNNNPNHTRFAQMFVSEARPSSTKKSSDAWIDWKERAGWNWAKDYNDGQYWTDNVTNFTNSNTMLEYNPQLGFVCAHHKRKHNGNMPSYFYRGDLGNYATKSHNYEPNRIKVSEDGRIFVSSFHPMSLCAVYEYTSAYDYHNVIDYDWKTNVVQNVGYSDGSNPLLYKRVIGMDVKGSGRDLTILLCWIDANAQYRNSKHEAQIEIWEYKLGEAEYNGDYYVNKQGSSSNKYLQGLTEDSYSRKVCTVDCDYTSNTLTSGGALYQGFKYTNKSNTKDPFYYNAVRGFVDIAYGTNNDAWIKVDYAWGYDVPAKIFRISLNNSFNTATTTVEKNNSSTSGAGVYGGSAIYVKDNRLYTSTGLGVIRVYDINNDGSLGSEKKDWRLTDNGGTTTRIGHWVTGFAEDYANNLYAVTEGYYTSNSEDFTANVVAIAMPYDGVRTTRSRNVFTASAPIPNILATDLKYEPVGTTDKYAFSFITNTKPTVAEIRFYKKNNRGNMDSNIATIHADNYDENAHKTIEPDYVYRFQGTELKQGLMEKTFTMVGGDPNQKELTDALPPGEMYWSVYVKTDKSSCFAPIYRSASYSTGTFHPLHATVNNYPETDMFGSLFVANNSDRNTTDRKTNGLLVYGLNPSGNANEFKLDDRERYEMRANYLNERITSGLLNYPRRMAVAPDGKVYIADEGAKPENWVGDFNGYKPVVVFSNGGIKVWDPKQPTQISTFTGGKINTASGVAFWGDPANKDSWKIYYSNTYDEFSKHVSNDKSNYTEEQQDNPTYYDGTNNSGYGWNGLVVHQIGNSKPLKELALGMGDASGNISVVAMEKGVWLCQYREHTVIIKDNLREPYADNMGAYLLSFVPYDADNRSTTYNPRTWTSCTTHGRTWSGSHPNFTYKDFDKSWWSQTQSSPLQSTPGGGLAYRKIDGEEFLFVVNHDGNIVKIKIDGWTGSGESVKPTMTADNDRVEILQTPGYTKCTKQAKKEIKNARGEVIYTYGPYNWTTSYINSMEFDYAGNLVTVTGSAASHSGATHEIIIYTMPYDRTNAQEIRAPESCIYIPERLHQMAMEEVDIQGVLNRHNIDGACAVDLYRPLQGGMFNTICLPFVLEMDHLNNPLAGSEVRQFTGATIESIGGENILCLEFTEVSTIQFNIPYIIKPQQNIKQIMRFNWPVTLAKSTEVKPDPKTFDTDNTITYQGILPKTQVDARYDQNLPLRLILVADNRLAALTGDGDMYGFRGYFDLLKPLPPGTVAKISAKKDTPTNTTIVVDGKKINIEKYLREGRVYIRVGDSLYTIDGQVVE